MTLEKRHRELLDQGDQLFSEKQAVDSLHQELAENFYPERADFTIQRSLGDSFAEGLDTSFPVIARRELGDAIGTILRPTNQPWFSISTKRPETVDDEGRRWLAMASRVQWRALYDRNSGFVRATKECDHDYAAFGQGVISSEISRSANGASILHRTWHLRDVAWKDGSDGRIGPVHRKWKEGAQILVDLFPKTASSKVRKIAEKEPFTEINCRHVVVPSHNYDMKTKQPFVSLYVDVDNMVVLEEKGIPTGYYVIPRWKTIPGSQYAFSPAAIVALPDARLVQAMTYTIVTAGEQMVNPALVGVSEAIKGAIETFPGGFTAVDALYDERLGEVLRPLNKGGERALPVGIDMVKDIRQQIAEAFYIPKLSMPPAGEGGMSPFEVQQRVAEFVRKALPLLEPIEQEYNEALMDQDFILLMLGGAFGPKQNIPDSIAGQDTAFTFENPLRQSIDRMKSQQLTQALQIVGGVAQVDPSAAHLIDWSAGTRDALNGAGTPPDWIRSPEDVQKLAQQQQQAQQMAAMAQAAGPVLEAVSKMKPEEKDQEVEYDSNGARR